MGKTLFSSGPKYSQLIRLQEFTILDHGHLWKETFDSLDLVHGGKCQRNVSSETSALVRCGQMCSLSNHISGFFYISGKNQVIS